MLKLKDLSSMELQQILTRKGYTPDILRSLGRKELLVEQCEKVLKPEDQLQLVKECMAQRRDRSKQSQRQTASIGERKESRIPTMPLSRSMRNAQPVAPIHHIRTSNVGIRSPNMQDDLPSGDPSPLLISKYKKRQQVAGGLNEKADDQSGDLSEKVDHMADIVSSGRLEELPSSETLHALWDSISSLKGPTSVRHLTPAPLQSPMKLGSSVGRSDALEGGRYPTKNSMGQLTEPGSSYKKDTRFQNTLSSAKVRGRDQLTSSAELGSLDSISTEPSFSMPSQKSIDKRKRAIGRVSTSTPIPVPPSREKIKVRQSPLISARFVVVALTLSATLIWLVIRLLSYNWLTLPSNPPDLSSLTFCQDGQLIPGCRQCPSGASCAEGQPICEGRFEYVVDIPSQGLKCESHAKQLRRVSKMGLQLILEHLRRIERMQPCHEATFRDDASPLGSLPPMESFADVLEMFEIFMTPLLGKAAPSAWVQPEILRDDAMTVLMESLREDADLRKLKLIRHPLRQFYIASTASRYRLACTLTNSVVPMIFLPICLSLVYWLWPRTPSKSPSPPRVEIVPSAKLRHSAARKSGISHKRFAF